MISAKKLRERRYSYYLEIIQNEIFKADDNGQYCIYWIVPESVCYEDISFILREYDYSVKLSWNDGPEIILKIRW